MLYPGASKVVLRTGLELVLFYARFSSVWSDIPSDKEIEDWVTGVFGSWFHNEIRTRRTIYARILEEQKSSY